MENRYHATAIESQERLLRCLVYIDLNMVRAGVVSHPSEWTFGGYNEIHRPRRKCILINYQKLSELTGFPTYAAFQKAHKNLVSESLGNNENSRQSQWTESIAVGNSSYIETIKKQLGILAGKRKILEKDDSFQLREEVESYNVDFDTKMDDIDSESSYYWNDNAYKAVCSDPIYNSFSRT